MFSFIMKLFNKNTEKIDISSLYEVKTIRYDYYNSKNGDASGKYITRFFLKTLLIRMIMILMNH